MIITGVQYYLAKQPREGETLEMANERLTPDMTLHEGLYAMSGGNAGAIRVLADIYKYGGQIDPDNCFAGFGTILSLDMLGIYESRIWKLYKYVCSENYMKTVAVVRAGQLGIISGVELENAIDNDGEGLDVEALVLSVKSRLPNFNTEFVAG